MLRKIITEIGLQIFAPKARVGGSIFYDVELSKIKNEIFNVLKLLQDLDILGIAYKLDNINFAQ